jgi:hypothetical protein
VFHLLPFEKLVSGVHPLTKLSGNRLPTPTHDPSSRALLQPPRGFSLRSLLFPVQASLKA